MSHFSVIVATKEYPTEKVLEYELQPFHEFECTGVDDEFVQDIDETEKLRSDWETDTTKRLRDPAGGLHEPWDDRFYRDPTPEESAKIGPIAGTGGGNGLHAGTGGGNGLQWSTKDWEDGKGYRTKVKFVPEGWEKVEVSRKETQTFREYVEGYCGKTPVPFGETPDTADMEKHKYGYALLDENGEVVKVIDRTNPSRKWDCWRVGGRYCRKFIAKPGAAGTAAPLSWEWEKRHGANIPDPPSGVDVIRVGDMDKVAMKSSRVADRKKYLDDTVSKCGLPADKVNELFAQKRDGHAKWMALEEPRPRGKEYGEWLAENGFPLAAVLHEKCWDSPDVPAGMTCEQWVNDAPYLTGFAFLRERKWAESGEMGWWGVVHGEKEAGDWEKEFQSLVDAVPDDWYLTVVDCHI